MLRVLASVIVLSSIVAAPARADVQPDEIALWNDPVFRKQFTNSYKAETEVEPSIDRRETETMQKVAEALSSGNLREAQRLLEREQDEKSSAVIDFTLGNVFFQREEWAAAAQQYERAVGKYEGFRRAWRNLAIVRIRLNQFDLAMPALAKVIELGGSDAIMFGLLGHCHAHLSNDVAAESAYRMAILLAPDVMDWQRGLARSFFQQGKYADAASLCETLIAANPDVADFWLLQANAYIGMREPMKAAQNYELVDRLGASTAASLNALADIYTNQGMATAASQIYVRALGLDEDAPLDRALAAVDVLITQGALDDATQLIQTVESMRADTLSSKDATAVLRLRARVAVERGMGDEQAEFLEEIVALDPLDGDALVLLGQHARQNGEPERAVMYFERAAKIPDTEALASIRHAQLLVNQGKYAEAVPLLRRAQSIKPQSHVQNYLERIERYLKATG